MTTIYRKQPVTVVRDAKSGDVDFDPDLEIHQVLIKHADGSQTAVPEDQLIDEKADSRPHEYPTKCPPDDFPMPERPAKAAEPAPKTHEQPKPAVNFPKTEAKKPHK